MTPKTFRFWQLWLVASCAGSVAVGLLLALAPFSAPLAPYVSNIGRAFWGTATIAPDSLALHAWSQAALGSTIAGWGATLACVALGPFGARDPWAPRAFWLGLVCWVPIDCAVSWRAGVTIEVAFNLCALAGMALPLLATRREFRRSGALVAA